MTAYASSGHLRLGSKTDGVDLHRVVTAPSLGAGLAADLGSLAMDNVTGNVWRKVGVADTAWTLLSAPVARGVAVVVDFGAALAYGATTTVVGQAWVTATSKLTVQASGATADHTAEDALIEQIDAIVENPVVGVGFDVRAHSPLGSIGQYAFLVMGVEA